MPVVRELVNRISFKVNKGDIKNAENAFGKLETKGQGLIVFFGKTLVNAIALASAALTSFQVKGTRSLIKFENDKSVSKFFSRNKQEATETIELFEKIAKESETTSRREAIRASKTFARFTSDKKVIQDLAGFVEKISIARGDLDFDEVASSLGSVINNADVQEMMDLVPGIKFDLEALSKSRFSAPFGETSKAQRAILVLGELIKRQERLDELVAEQKETVSFAAEKVGRGTENFFLKFGEETAEPIKELLTEISNVIDDINDSEAFWGFVKGAAETVRDAFLITKKTIQEINEKGLLGFGKAAVTGSEEEAKKIIDNYRKQQQNRPTTEQLLDEAFQFFGGPVPKVSLGGGQSIGGGPGIFKESEQILKGEDPKIVTAVNSLIDWLQSNLRPQFQSEVKVVHSGNVESKGTEIKEALNSIIAENGGLVTTQ